MKLSDFFSKADHQRAAQLIVQQDRYLNLAKIELDKGNFEKSALFSNHATAITTELARMNNSKILTDEAVNVLEQIKQRELTDQMLRRRKDWF